MLIDRNSDLWKYLDGHLKGLIIDGEELLADSEHHKLSISDYSYLVFPFAKAYEGFLKRLFLDLKLIDKADFYSDSIRIGRILNPTFSDDHHSVYGRVGEVCATSDLSDSLWLAWRSARNMVFHYYPHNFRKLSYKEAKDLIQIVIDAMANAMCAVPTDLINKERDSYDD